jgi:hypothetical protein
MDEWMNADINRENQSFCAYLEIHHFAKELQLGNQAGLRKTLGLTLLPVYTKHLSLPVLWLQ